MALALAMVLQATPTPAVAVTGYDSAFLFESDWLIVRPGESGQAAVTFLNVGSVSWQKGGASQVNLATCCPLNSPPTHASWAVTWLSSTAYATHREDLVAPGGRGTYIWNFKAPDTAAAGIYDFPGDLVLASTGEAVHREGYFHRNDLRVAAPTLAPTKLALAPKSTAQVVGSNVTLTATVTAEPETGSTTRRAVANAEVTFIVDAGANDVGNSDFTRTATTDANGVASIAYTRSNPGTDNISAYVTTSPTVRDTAVVQWGVAAAFAVTPTDAVTLPNDQCRVYSSTAKDATTGAKRTGTFHINFLENFQPTAGNNDGGATIAADTTGSPDNTTSINSTTNADGIATFQVCGASASTKTVTPVVFDDNAGLIAPNTAQGLDNGDRFGTGGSIKFEARTPTFTVTPDDAATLANNGQRVYTVTAVDQFGAPWTKALGATIGFVELTDDLTTTTTSAKIAWTDISATPTTSTSTGAGIPSGSSAVSKDTQTPVTVTLNASGKATFALYSTAATSTADDAGTPVVWFDKAVNNLRESDEKQDTGGNTTWKVPAGTSVSLTSALTRPTSTEDPVTNNASFGEGNFLFKILDQSGNATSPSANQTITFVVTNTGNADIVITDVDTAAGTCLVGGVATAPPVTVAAGASLTCSATYTTTDVSTNIELDSKNVSSASISSTGAGGSASSSATWISCAAEPAAPGFGTTTIAGTVAFKDTTAGIYCIKTTTAGNFLIVYGPGDAFKVDGTTTTSATFNSNITVNDDITWTIETAGGETHSLTNK